MICLILLIPINASATDVTTNTPVETTTEEITTASIEDVRTGEIIQDIKFYDVPLDEELQLYIIDICEEKHISHALVMAMIEQESQYDVNVVGDNGNSLGLMQVQSRWHQERMDRLGCDNLLDPYQNVTVAVDYLYELFQKNPDVYWVMMAYNGGSAYASERMKTRNYSEYAVTVVDRAEELERSYYGKV